MRRETAGSLLVVLANQSSFSTITARNENGILILFLRQERMNLQKPKRSLGEFTGFINSGQLFTKKRLITSSNNLALITMPPVFEFLRTPKSTEFAAEVWSFRSLI